MSTADQKSNDPSNYVNLVDDETDLAGDGTTTDIQYNTNLIAQGQKVDVTNQNLARITLKQVQPGPGSSLTAGTVSLVFNSASARLYDKNGNALTSLTANYGDTSYLAGLFSGNVDVDVEGLQADSDFSITYNYVDANSVTHTASIHMAIADISLIDGNGTHDPRWKPTKTFFQSFRHRVTAVRWPMSASIAGLGGVQDADRRPEQRTNPAGYAGLRCRRPV